MRIKKAIYICEQSGTEFIGDSHCREHEKLCLDEHIKKLEDRVKRLEGE